MKRVWKSRLGVFSFFFAIIFGLVGMFLPPIGIIDNSVLIFIAQLLVFCSNILGFNLDVFKPDSDV